MKKTTNLGRVLKKEGVCADEVLARLIQQERVSLDDVRKASREVGSLTMQEWFELHKKHGIQL